MKQLVKWMNDPRLTKWLGPRFPISLAEQEIWYERLTHDKTKSKLFIEDKGGTAIGLISLMELDWRNRTAELGIYIGEHEYLARGFGRDAVLTLLRFAFRELGLHRIYLSVFEENRRAIRTFQRSGFVLEAVMRDAAFYAGRYHNVFLMSILAAEFDGDLGR